MPRSTPEIAHHAALDARMVDAVRDIRLLTLLSWPIEIQQSFLEQHVRGHDVLPQVAYARHDYSDTRRELAAISAEADPGHPLGAYLIDSTRNWSIAAQLLESLGTHDVTTHSVALYGRPDHALPGGGTTTREAAHHFIDIANELDHSLLSPAEQVTISATALQLQLQNDLDGYFGSREIEVVLDPHMIAKAAAGSRRIRLRSGAEYTDYDHHQLLQHEAFVHSLTALNGREQPVLSSLGLSSPRTTVTQEGLATFAEQITGNIDIERMKRVSLRIEAIAMALDGADFIDVFRYFLANGQPANESFSSAQRVFRGVPLTGGAAFTKDAVYLRGLIGVHTFFRWALRQDKLHLCRLLFAGKMTLRDVQQFEPLFDDSDGDPVLLPPHWLPEWVARANGLAGMLAFSLFANRIRLDEVGDDVFTLDL